VKIDRYEVLETLGSGGFGTVYRARDPFIRRDAAIKVSLAADKETTDRFFREARIAGSLSHPNLAVIYDFGIHEGAPYLVQEFLPGVDLELLVGRVPLPLEFVISVLVQVARGLAAAHEKGVIHRDIKPSNIRILPDGQVKLLDFGIAKLVHETTGLTRTGEALGTVGYFSPEILLGKPLDHRSDLFSLGAVAYEMVTERRPFQGDDLGRVLYAIVHENPPDPRKINPKIPETLSQLILALLAKDPEARPTSTATVARQLETLAAELGVSVGQIPPPAVPQSPRGGLGTLGLSPYQAAPKRWHQYLPFTLLALGAVSLLFAGLWWRGSASNDAQKTLPTNAPSQRLAPPTPSLEKPTRADQLSFPAPVPSPTPKPGPRETHVEKVKVELTLVPPAHVKVDGEDLGKVARQTVELTKGTHLFTYGIPGFRWATTTVNVTEATSEIILRLPEFGFLTVFPDFGVRVKGTEVAVDGKPFGPLPVVDAKVSAGTHRVTVRFPEGAVVERTVEVEEGKRTTVVIGPGS